MKSLTKASRGYVCILYGVDRIRTTVNYIGLVQSENDFNLKENPE